MFRTGVYANVFDFGLIISIWPSTSSTIRGNEQHRHSTSQYVCDGDDRNRTWIANNFFRTNFRPLCERDVIRSRSHFHNSAIWIHLYTMPVITIHTIQYHYSRCRIPSWIITENSASSVILPRAGVCGALTALFHLGCRSGRLLLWLATRLARQ